jgi:hypothetical protein
MSHKTHGVPMTEAKRLMLVREIIDDNSENYANLTHILSPRNAECMSIKVPLRFQSYVTCNLLTSKCSARVAYATSATVRVFATRISARKKERKRNGRAIAQAVSRRLPHRDGPGSIPGLVMWDFMMDKSGAGAGFL